MEIQFLGGATEVGRLGMLLRTQGTTLLFDYGIQPDDPPKYPLEAPPVDALYLTHSHLDHCGLIPVVCRATGLDLISTPVTFDVSRLLLEDSLKVSAKEGYPEPFLKPDLETMNRRIQTTDYGETMTTGSVPVTVHSAGHIPGSCMYEVEGAQHLVFTGDLQTRDSRLVAGADRVSADILALEATYAGRNHPPRAETEAAFLAKVREVVARGGVALVPCFAVARTQEVLMILAETDLEVWLDGMGRDVSQLYLRHPSYLRDDRELRAALERTEVIWSQRGRHLALKGEVIVTTGGMMDGGPVLFYLDRLRDDGRSAVLLTGYQVEGTNGRRLLEEGVVEIQGVSHPIQCEVRQYDFSAHAGHDELVRFVDRCDPEKVILMHGDSRGLLAEALEGRECLLPEEGRWYTV